MKSEKESLIEELLNEKFQGGAKVNKGCEVVCAPFLGCINQCTVCDCCTCGCTGCEC